MPLEIFFGMIILAVLLIGSYTDLKTREVPDTINYGLIIAGIGLRLIWSLASSDWSYIIEGLLGLALCAALAYSMFYAGQWGGGDAKMMMGLGAFIGLDLNFDTLLVGFLFNIFIIGAVYALAWSVFLAIKNRKKFVEEYKKFFRMKKTMLSRKIVLISAVLMLIPLYFVKDNSVRLVFFLFVLLCVATFYLWIFVRVIERSCMLKLVPPEKLTEGDWIVKDVVVNGKRITGPKDLGISLEQIAELKKLRRKNKIKEILIKEGIPFVPSFLISFIVTWIFGNLFMMLV
ncbi:MAG: A24 family peptidase [Candidatus Woesearchaeota archaeon]|nr:A24 family peptidase [Candidatus Woesearchaeota archaeon]